MNGTGDNYVKQKKPDLQRQILHAFSHKQNLDVKTKKNHESRRGTTWEKEGNQQEWAEGQ
jgi:hypothetical protein